MIEWTVIEWDLATPLKEELRGKHLKHIDIENRPVMPPSTPVLTLKSLGKLVEEQFAREGGAEHVNRSEPQFIWADLRIVFEDGGPLTPAHFEKIRNDPLLHQRLFDVVQEVFREACREIAREIIWYDNEKDRSQVRAVPGMAQMHDPLAFDLARNIKMTLSKAQHKAIEKLVGVQGSLGREVAGRETGGEKGWAWVKVGLGGLGVLCCVAGIIGLATASGGILAPLFIGIAATAGTRSFFDTLKGFHDRVSEAETVGKRLEDARKIFEASTSKNGAKRTAEAIANATVKFSGVVGYNLLGFGKCASLHDIADDIKLYEKKLNTLRADAHDLSAKLNQKLEEIETRGVPIASQNNIKIKVTPQEIVMGTKQEAAIHKLIVDVTSIHSKCDQQLAALPELKSAVAEVIESNGKVYLKLEKWLDFGINLLQTGGGLAGGVLNWGGWSDTFTVLGGLDDTVLESDQALSNSSSKAE